MTVFQNFYKHIQQIKSGGILTIIKKLRSFIYLILQIPIYLISIPAVIIIHLIRPWFLIRWNILYSSRIGHFASNTELYCCERDAGINTPSQRYADFFYLRKYIANKQLEKMWRRNLIILPTWLLLPICRVNRFFCFFIPSCKEHEIRDNANSDRDVHNLIEKFTVHIGFTYEEKIKGREILKKFGLPDDAKFVCLLVRDSGYLDRNKKYESHERWSYHSYRDGDIDKYVLAAEELARRGYYVFRMGVNVSKPLKSSNPKVIDYANSKIRSEFMDIYLGAKCSFGITTGTGFDEIPRIFRKPIVWVYVPLGYIITNNEKDLIITKHHINKKNKNKLTISEIFSSNVAVSLYANEFKKNDIELKENTPEEIRDLVVEMEERLTGCWHETEEDLLLQKKFWSIFKENINQLRLKMPLHGKMKSRFGAKFLRDNQNWIK